MMDARVHRGAWHLLDARPPSNAMARGIEAAIATSIPVFQMLVQKLPALLPGQAQAQFVLSFLTWAQPQVPQMLDSRPVSGPHYDHVQFSSNTDAPVWEQSISIASIRDIGVAHTHMHQQYESISGGELQMLWAGPTPGMFPNHRELYQFLNGPVADADGYNDGTCNYYMLAQLTDGTFALLYIDEQTFFSQRWRYAHPDDHNGAAMSLAGDLAANPGAYRWSRATFWSPFETPGLIGARSRLAVSAYVVLVTGDFQPGSPPPPVYSLNFSWGTMDRTWRWRAFPPGTIARELTDPADETVPADTSPNAGHTVYPQTIRLRDDMTVHVKGTLAGVPGRWYQRYLPADNGHVPPAEQLVAGARPALPYPHPWKFVTEAAFQSADRFSHFGVYDEVDSRTQYYPVDPVSFAALDAAHVAPDDWWVDTEHKLSITAYTFALDTMQVPWFPWPPFPKVPLQPASLFNDAAMLRFVKRGARWIAVRADKRDDDLVPYDVIPPAPVTFARRGRDGTARPGTIGVVLQAGQVVPAPPAVQTAFFWWEGGGATAAIAYSGRNVARVRMAALDAAGAVVPLLDANADAFRFDAATNAFVYRWSPPADDANRLRTYASEDAARGSGTSIWFEDLSGHVAPPELVMWRVPLQMRVAVSPEDIPYGVQVAVTVSAFDSLTGAAIVDPSSSIVIEDVATGHALGETFPYTFQLVADPDDTGGGDGGHKPGPRPKPPHPPAGAVRAGRYPTTPIPFAYYTRALDVTVDRTAFTIGQSAQLTVVVREKSSRAHAPLAANVSIGGASLGVTSADPAKPGATFTHTFGSNDRALTVTRDGYPAQTIALQLAAPPPPPSIVVTVDPPVFPPGRRITVTVHAADSNTHVPLTAGTVAVNGTVVGTPNVPFPFVVPKARPVLPHGKGPVDGGADSITVTVSCPGYADVSVDAGGGV